MYWRRVERRCIHNKHIILFRCVTSLHACASWVCTLSKRIFPPITCVFMLAASVLLAAFVSFVYGFSLLMLTLIGVPWYAERRTREHTNYLDPVTLSRHQP